MSTKLLQKYLSKWNLKNPKHITNTATGYIYAVDSDFGPAVLKMFTELGFKDESSGTDYIKACCGEGVVKLYASDDGAQLLELLYDEQSSVGTFNVEKDSEAFASILKQTFKCKLPLLENKLRSVDSLFNAFERVSVPAHLDVYFEKALKLFNELRHTQDKTVLLHGDLHHQNVMQNKKGQYVCFDPKGFIGDPSYEIATILNNPTNSPHIVLNLQVFQSRVTYFSESLNLPVSRIIRYTYVYLCLSIAWSIEDGFDYDQEHKFLQMIHPIIEKSYSTNDLFKS